METNQIIDSHLSKPNLFKNNKNRARNVVQVFYAFLIITFLIFLIDLNEYFKDYDQISYEFNSEEILSSDYIALILLFIYMVINILAIITFIKWFRRAYWNLHNSKKFYLTHREGMAAGSWFIPFLNLFYPYQIMKDIWKKMQEYIASTKDNYQIKSIQIVSIWWFLYIVNTILNRIAFRLSINAESVDAYIDSISVNLVSHLVQIIALLAAIKVIKETFDIEEKFYKSFNI